MVRIPFLRKWVHFRLVSLSQNSKNCLLANQWWNTCLLPLLFFYIKISHLFSQTSAGSVIRYFSLVVVVFPDYYFLRPSLQYSFSYGCRWLLLNTSSVISYLIFLNKFFWCLDAERYKCQLIDTSNGTLCKYLAKFI